MLSEAQQNWARAMVLDEIARDNFEDPGHDVRRVAEALLATRFSELQAWAGALIRETHPERYAQLATVFEGKSIPRHMRGTAAGLLMSLDEKKLRASAVVQIGGKP